MSDDDDEPPGFPMLMAIPAINWIVCGVVSLGVSFAMALGFEFLLVLLFALSGIAFLSCGIGIFAGQAVLIGPVTILTALAAIAALIEGLILIGNGSWEAGLFFAFQALTLAVSAMIAVELVPRWNDWVEACRAAP